jgi:hypothetical protein
MKHIRLTLPLILCSIIGIFLLLKLKLLFARQFDPDEFAYLHWAWLTVQGKIPYRDFFFYATPIFLWPLSIVFLFGNGPGIAIGGRLLMFLVYGGVLACTYSLAYSITKHKITSILTLILLLSFPMTYDKTIEIRPDTLMMLLFLGSFLLIGKGKYILAGILSGINILMFQKIIILLPSLIPLFLTQLPQVKKRSFLFAAGTCIPAGMFLLYLVSQHILWDAWNAVVNISRLVNNDQWGFPPLTGLMPYPYVYLTEGGISFPWIINTSIILLSLPGILLLFWKTKKTPSIFFFSILFYLLSIVLFLLFPRPHMQYFIPFTIIASLFTAITIQETLTFITTFIHTRFVESILYIAIALTLLTSFSLQTIDRVRDGNTNDEQVQVLRDTARIIKPDETVYDEVGSYIFRPDGYFICCHHYEQFVDKLDPSLWSLKEHLIQNKTKFIILDQKGFAFWTPKPEDVNFIITHYAPSAYKKIYTLGIRFQCDKHVCKQLNVHGNPISEKQVSSFPIVIEEQYVIHIQPEGEEVSINNSSYHNRDSIRLPVGTYTFAPRIGVTGLSVQLDR